MPRQIIDTQSSRPAYVRRRWLTALATVAFALVAAYAAWTFLAAHHHVATSTPAVAPGNSAH
ncbi:MAG: hypothetical protein ACYDGM_12280 [Vulcanimicrobiaceae bacterium]